MVTPFPAKSTSVGASQIRSGVAALKVEGTWSGGRIHGAIKSWAGVDAELWFQRPHHTIAMTLSGGSELTGTRISGSPTYEGRDRPGCVTFVPAGAEKLGWYRNADLTFIVLQIDPDLVPPAELGQRGQEAFPFTNRCDPFSQAILWTLSREMQGEAGRLPSIYAEHAVGLLLSHILRSNMADRRAKVRLTRGLSHTKLSSVLRFIEDHLDQDISLSKLGALTHMTPDVFARHFKAHVGMAPYRYVMERRIRRAEALLQQEGISIADIALAVGFSSQSHLTTQFSRMVGETPAAYRARHRA